MSGPEFHQTGYGRRFFDAQLPELTTQISRLATAIEKANAIAEAKREPSKGWQCVGCGQPDNTGEACSHCGSLCKDDATQVAARKASRKKKPATKAADRPLIGTPQDLARVLAPKLDGLMQEVFWIATLNVRNHLTGIVEVARGSVVGVEVHPREVFRPAIEIAAAGIVLAHNHPSGDPTPSEQDIELTRRLRSVGDLVGIPVVDHVVVTAEGSFRSIAEMLGTAL